MSWIEHRENMKDIENKFHYHAASDLNMGCEDFKKLYSSLHEEPRRELRKYLLSLKQMETNEHLRELMDLRRMTHFYIESVSA
jgi:hypothetical protein